MVDWDSCLQGAAGAAGAAAVQLGMVKLLHN